MKQRREIEIFINGIKHYFQHLEHSQEDFDDDIENENENENEKSLNIGAPYLVKNTEKIGFQHTGMINISGDSSGVVFFSSSAVMLKYIILGHKQSDFSELMMNDMVGEIANTLTGNARKELGDNFHISPPTVLKGRINNKLLADNKHAYIIPIRWRNHNAQLIVSLKNTHEDY